MNHPGGIGAAHGHQYHHVAPQMQAYVNNGGGGQNLHAAHGHMHPFQSSNGVQFGSNVPYTGPQHFGFSPVIANDLGGFGIMYMPNLMY